MTVRIGITGPIGCGKSTVAAWLAELGATVVDADVLARDVVEPGEPALDAVFATFGEPVRTPDGRLDRAALARIVFGDPTALARLERIVHPPVRVRILAAIAAAEARAVPAVVIEAIKLVEGGLVDLCDEVWFVTCDAAAQRSRLAERGLSAGEAAARIAAQASILDYDGPVRIRAIDTSGAVGETRALVTAAWRAAISGPTK